MKELGNIIEQRVLPNHEQIVIFSPYMEFNGMLQRYLFERLGVGCLLFDSAHQSTPEGHPIELFKQKKYPVLIMIDKSGGEGLNLQNANHVADFSPSWNPQAQSQRIARVHRLQPKHDTRKLPDVHVYHFVTYIKEHANANVNEQDRVWERLMPGREFVHLEVPNNGLATIDVRIENILRAKKELASALLDNHKIEIPEQNTRALLSQTVTADVLALQKQ
jgi:hypothetical protein